MNTMSDKPIYRVLNALSILALTYYAATSLHYIFESEAAIKLSSYETATSTLLTGKQGVEEADK